MRIRRYIFFTALSLLSACSSIPAPEPVVGYNKPFAPWNPYPRATPQTAWRLDGERRYDVELGYDCYGSVRYIDPVHHIDTFAGVGYLPDFTVDSDDPDIVFSVLGIRKRLYYSMDGGRHFYQDLRGFPNSVDMIAVRNGYIYVGLNMGWTENGYAEWPGPYKLVVLEAKLDKERARIGRFKLLVPRGHQFKNGVPEYARGDVRWVDSLAPFRLPTRPNAPGPEGCKRLKLPPYHFDDPVEFIAWVDATARANPRWITPDKVKFAHWIRRVYTKRFEEAHAPDIDLDALLALPASKTPQVAGQPEAKAKAKAKAR